jgi:hypothetical protein
MTKEPSASVLVKTRTNSLLLARYLLTCQNENNIYS